MGRIAGDAAGGSGKPGAKIDFGLIRASFARAGLSPRAWEEMSLYELESMWRSFRKLDKDGDKPQMTQGLIDEMKVKWASLNLPDVKVQ